MFPLWTEKQVKKALNSPAAEKYMRQREEEAAEQRREQEIRELLEGYSPDYYISRAQKLSRFFILHVGPTNSGKTFDAVEDLKKSPDGGVHVCDECRIALRVQRPLSVLVVP